MNPSRIFSFLLVLQALLLGSSCGAAPVPHTVAERETQLGEARALEVIEATLRERGMAFTPGWDLDLGGELRFRVDVHLGAGDFGIEYVTGQDRADEPTLPEPPRSRELQILPGAGDDARAQVLLLDERAYAFDPHSEHVQAGATSAQDAEGRLGRDVGDFVEYVHGQGGQ